MQCEQRVDAVRALCNRIERLHVGRWFLGAWRGLLGAAVRGCLPNKTANHHNLAIVCHAPLMERQAAAGNKSQSVAKGCQPPSVYYGPENLRGLP